MPYSNYALITALYSNTMRGLYSDVYFPIIKYSICKVFSEKKDDNYSSPEEIHEYINERFHLSIPSIVIAMSVKKIAARNWGNMDFEVYQQSDSFKINCAYMDDIDDIEERERIFISKQQDIEKEYQSFIEREGMFNDGLTFIQFISDNTDDILGYFEKKDLCKVDEKYVTLIFFLQYLADYKTELYTVANLLFWSSIIAAFLRSENPLVDDETNGVKTEYFLDTSVVMGLLNLSTPQRETNSKELRDIIKSAGGILRVHPMTVREISTILQKVETSTPNPFTSIASAFHKYNYDTQQIASKRVHIEDLIKSESIDIFPSFPPIEQNKAIDSYKGKKVTRLLGETRTKNPEPYSSDNYREIHDIFMHNYIMDRQKHHSGDVCFVTNNKDLISFTREMNPDVYTMKTPGKIILDLWMHNTKPTDISGCALTETMAMCLEQHSLQIRNKIAEVSRYYNQTKDNFDAEVYKDFIQKLYKRARHVITTIEEDPDNFNSYGESFAKLIAEAVKADDLHYNQEVASVKNENEELTSRVEKKEEEIKDLTSKQESDADTIKALSESLIKEKKKTAKAEEETRIADEAKKLAQESEQKEKVSRLQSENATKLYKELREKEQRLTRGTNEKKAIEENTRNKFCNWLPWLLTAISVVFFAGIILIWVAVNTDAVDSRWNVFWLMPIPATFLGIAIKLFVDTSERRNKYIKEHLDSNETYKDLYSENIKLQERIKEIKDELDLKETE